MGISVYVMPLHTNLLGNFSPTMGVTDAGCPALRRTVEEAEAAFEGFADRLESLLGFRPEWDEEGPVRSATIFSVDNFSRPFFQARSWSYRLKLPCLCAMELPQVWIPVEFEPAFRFSAPWSPDSDISVASSLRMQGELERLLEEMSGQDRPDLAETFQVANKLREIAALSVEHRTPVITEELPSFLPRRAPSPRE